MAIATVDMKHGMAVALPDSYGDNSGAWEVLDKHPNNRNWWLHRWTDGVWETTYAHETEMTADVETLDAPLLESDKWTKAPFNIADAKTVPALPKRKTGYVFGKWAAHKREDWTKAWQVTHLPTGLSIGSRPTLPLVRELLTQLQTEDLPELHGTPFGVRPGDAARPELARLRTLLEVS